MKPRRWLSGLFWLLATGTLHGSPEADEVVGAATKLLELKRVAWSRYFGAVPPEQKPIMKGRIMNAGPLAPTLEAFAMQRGRWEKGGEEIAEQRASKGVWFVSYRGLGDTRAVLTHEGWLNSDEVMQAYRAAQGQVKWVQYLGVEFEQQEVLAVAYALVQMETPRGELSPLLSHVTEFTTEGKAIKGVIETRYAAQKYLRGRRPSLDSEGKAYFTCWIVDGMIERYIVDVAGIATGPSQSDHLTKKTVIFDFKGGEAIEPPADAIEKIRPR